MALRDDVKPTLYVLVQYLRHRPRPLATQSRRNRRRKKIQLRTDIPRRSLRPP
jgi:hypothetical protein